MSTLMADVADVLPLFCCLAALAPCRTCSLFSRRVRLQLRAELGDIKGLLQNQTALMQHLASRRTSSSPAATPTLNLPVQFGPGFMLPCDCFCCMMAAQIPIHCVCVCVFVCVCMSVIPPQLVTK